MGQTDGQTDGQTPDCYIDAYRILCGQCQQNIQLNNYSYHETFRKLGGLGWLKVTSSSPLDRAHVTSYSSLIETSLQSSCTTVQVLVLHIRLVPFLTFSKLSKFKHLAPLLGGDLIWFSPISLASQNYAIVRHCLHNPVYPFQQKTLTCGWRMNRQRQMDGHMMTAYTVLA